MQVKDNSKDARFKPFGHLSAGAARYRSRIRQTVDVFPDFNFAVEDPVTSFAMKVGGNAILSRARLKLRLPPLARFALRSGIQVSDPYPFAGKRSLAVLSHKPIIPFLALQQHKAIPALI